jgi:hypothetical protein
LNAAGQVNFGMQMTKKLVNPEQCHALTGMLTFNTASQSAERYHSFVTCAVTVADLVAHSVTDKEILTVF